MTYSWQIPILILAALIYTSLPAFLSLLSDGRTQGEFGTTSSVELTDSGLRVRSLLEAAFFATSLLIIASNFFRLPKLQVGRLLLLLAPLGLLFLVNFLTTGEVSRMLGAFIAFTIAFWSAAPKANEMRIFALFGGGVAVFSLVMAWVTDLAWQPAEEKAYFAENALAGPFSQMNVAGMAFVVLLPFSFALTRLRSRILCFVALGACLALTASRTAMVAGAVAIAVAIVVAVAKRASVKKVIIVGAALALTAASVWLPLTTTDRTLYTNRGGIWISVLELSERSWLTGHGLGTFRLNGPLFQQTHTPAPHGHNMFIHYYGIGGLLGIAVIAIILLAALVAVCRLVDRTSIPAIALISVLALGLTEAPLRPETFDGPAWATWSVLLFCVFVEGKEATMLDADVGPETGTRYKARARAKASSR